MKQIPVITARHTSDGMMYTWKIGKQQLVELVMALTNHRNFVLAVETKYGSKLVEYVGTRLEEKEIAKDYKRVQAVLVGYDSSHIEGFNDDEEEEDDLNQDSSSVFPEEGFLEEEFEDIEE